MPLTVFILEFGKWDFTVLWPVVILLPLKNLSNLPCIVDKICEISMNQNQEWCEIATLSRVMRKSCDLIPNANII